MFKIFWLAGENSGDLHASMIIKQLNSTGISFEHTGVGGYHMQNEGLKTLFPFNRFNVMGFVEVIKHLNFFSKVEKTIKNIFINNKPNLVVLVDYPGLNLRVAKMAYDLDIPVFYYICPQFWAWKHHRVNQLAEYTNYVACILPFEPDLLHIHKVEAEYVGHPIVEEINNVIDKQTFAKVNNLDLNKKWISFFPGSRMDEVEKLLPVYLKTIDLLDLDKYKVIISRAPNFHEKLFRQLMETYTKNPDKISVMCGNNYELMTHSDFLVAKSGTSTLEAAYIGNPFIICYKANQLSYLIGKKIVKIKYIGLPNILLDKPVIPELIQHEVNPQNIARHIETALGDEKEYQKTKQALSELREVLGTRSASKVTANKIMEILKEKYEN